MESVTAQLEGLRGAVEEGMDCGALQAALPAGPARNALDCALWDLEAKRHGTSVATLAGLPPAVPRQTAFTLSLDTPERLAEAARAAKAHALLKVKLGSDAVLDSVAAICAARPDATLVVDANEAFAPADYPALHRALGRFPISLVEQPVPAGQDRSLPDTGPVICADESLHTAADLPRLQAAGYRAVNVKLDKCGGFTAALELMRAARAADLQVMAGCMVGSSLAMAPMMVLESLADVVDLDGPLLLAEDEMPGLVYEGDRVHPPVPELWG